MNQMKQQVAVWGFPDEVYFCRGGGTRSEDISRHEADGKKRNGVSTCHSHREGHDSTRLRGAETAPCATLVYWETDDIRVIGLPTPGTTLKLVPDEPNRVASVDGGAEIRVTGPNITKRYVNNPQATEGAFDEEGFYRTGDAAARKRVELPSLIKKTPTRASSSMGGLAKTSRHASVASSPVASGCAMPNYAARSVNTLGKPYLTEVVLAAPNKPYTGALVIPNIGALRSQFESLSAQYPDNATFLNSEAVVERFRPIFRQHNANQTGASCASPSCLNHPNLIAAK